MIDSNETKCYIGENATNKIKRHIKSQGGKCASVIEIWKEQKSSACLKRAVRAPNTQHKAVNWGRGTGQVGVVGVNLGSLTFLKGLSRRPVNLTGAWTMWRQLLWRSLSKQLQCPRKLHVFYWGMTRTLENCVQFCPSFSVIFSPRVLTFSNLSSECWPQGSVSKCYYLDQGLVGKLVELAKLQNWDLCLLSLG